MPKVRKQDEDGKWTIYEYDDTPAPTRDELLEEIEGVLAEYAAEDESMVYIRLPESLGFMDYVVIANGQPLFWKVKTKEAQLTPAEYAGIQRASQYCVMVHHISHVRNLLHFHVKWLDPPPRYLRLVDGWPTT